MTSSTTESYDTQLALILFQLKSLTDAVEKQNEDHEARIRLLEGTVGRLSERLTIWQIGQSLWTTVASVIAAVVGKNT